MLQPTLMPPFSKFFGGIMAEQFAGKTCLELGCGSGVVSEMLAGNVSALDLVDGSSRILNRARSKITLPHVRFFHSLIESYEPDHKYDGIIASHVLEHVDDPVGILRRIKEWLAPTGILMAFVPNANSMHRQLGVAMGLSSSVYELSERDHLLHHRRVYDPDSLARDIRVAGLEPGQLCGVLIKAFPNAMMESLPTAMIDGFLELGRRIPHLASDIYYECRRPPDIGR